MTSGQIDDVRRKLQRVRDDVRNGELSDAVEDLDAILDELLEHSRDAFTRECREVG